VGGECSLSGPGMSSPVSAVNVIKREREEILCVNVPPRARWNQAARSLRESTCVCDASEDNELLCAHREEEGVRSCNAYAVCVCQRHRGPTTV
jgi:hypothetical protein